MILPVVAYGRSILRQKSKDIDRNFPGLDALIENMWQTLYSADGSGLAAPQVNLSVKLFIVDSKEIYDNMDDEDRLELFSGDEGIKETFINAKITEYSDEKWIEKEGC